MPRKPFRYMRRKPPTKRFTTVAKLAKRVRKIERQPEYQSVDTSVQAGVTTSYPIAGSGTITLLSATDQGDGFGDRDGNKIIAKHITLKGSVEHQASGATGQHVRVIVFVDRNNVGTAPTAAELMISDSAIEFPNSALEDKRRFRILYDKRLAVGSISDQIKTFKFSKRLNHTVLYNGGDGGSNFAQGNIWCYVESSQATSNAPLGYIKTRFSFIDA